MPDPPKKSLPLSPEANEAAARLKRIAHLWQQLQLIHSPSPEYDVLIDQIRAETDAFRTILEAKKELGSEDPKD